MLWFGLGSGPEAPEFAVIRPKTDKGVIEALKASKDYSVSKPVAETVGGIEAQAIDIQVPALPGGGTPAPGSDAVLLNVEDNVWYVPHDRQVHLIELTVGGKPVVVTWDAKPSEYAAFDALARAIVASMQFEAARAG